MIPLIMAGTGTTNTVKKVGGKEETKHFLSNMGFTEGAECSVVSANDGNVIVNIRDTRVALDRGMASKIYV
ncbi:MAG: FeoA family protein [Catonella sp.]|nr:FeoA family protein [Catonella sp.]MDY6357207.1 FeoA family protein [Catonella sp.]